VPVGHCHAHVLLWELWILLDDGFGSRRFHVCVEIFGRSVDEVLLSVVIPLRSSRSSRFDKQVIPIHQL
jgi:hypothetical protein